MKFRSNRKSGASLFSDPAEDVHNSLFSGLNPETIPRPDSGGNHKLTLLFTGLWFRLYFGKAAAFPTEVSC